MTGIAIVGRGFMGSTHARALASLGRGEHIRYIVARTGGGIVEAAPSATVVTDFEVALKDPTIDVVSICTPTGTHRELAVRALRAGKNVLLEKPIALTMPDSIAIYDEATRSGKTFMIAQVVRFFRGYRQLRHDVADGKLGRMLSARASRIGAKPDWAEWLRDYAEAGGMLVDFGIHDFDQVNLFLGDPVEVSATAASSLGPVETTITYREGGIGHVHSFADLRAGVPFRSSLEVVGTEGFARYEYAAETPKLGASDAAPFRRVSHYSLSASAHESELELGIDEPYAQQLEYFLNCVAQGVEPGYCSTPSALLALEVALAATRSVELGVPVRLNSN